MFSPAKQVSRRVTVSIFARAAGCLSCSKKQINADENADATKIAGSEANEQARTGVDPTDNSTKTPSAHRTHASTTERNSDAISLGGR